MPWGIRSEKEMTKAENVLFRNANVLDLVAGKILAERSVLVREGKIAEVEGSGLKLPANTRELDVKGMTLMPGLVDAHVHTTAVTADLAALTRWAPSYVTARSSTILAGMLMRGFTTVRDAGGADYGLAAAVQEGYLTGPRVLFCGHALSQTGGHGDMRSPGDHSTFEGCFCAGLGLICDGVDEVRRATRNEIRKGATHIKLMASGGVASPTDRITSTQFSAEEMTAIVEEAEAASLYVLAHAYTARSINRALSCGVRSIEHGNLLDDTSIDLFLQKDAFLVPTLVTYYALAKDKSLPGWLHAKLGEVLDAGIRALELAYRRGVPIAFGSDLLGAMQEQQLTEFALRSEVQPALEVLRAATINAAKLLRREGQIGIVAPGALADLLVLDGNPLENIGAVQDPQRYLKLIMKDGTIYKNELPNEGVAQGMRRSPTREEETACLNEAER
jgi:imidazolonepropionase-like amidohydrolase